MKVKGISAVMCVRYVLNAKVMMPTNMIICVEALNNPVVSLEWVAPPPPHRPEEKEAHSQVKREMMVGHKVVMEEFT